MLSPDFLDGGYQFFMVMEDKILTVVGNRGLPQSPAFAGRVLSLGYQLIELL